MHGTLVLSHPGCSVPKFVDDLFQVVQRQKKKKLGFVFNLRNSECSSNYRIGGVQSL